MSETVSHVHDWRKTGEFFAISPPLWVVVCDGCFSVAQRQEAWPPGDVEQVRQVSPADFRKIVNPRD